VTFSDKVVIGIDPGLMTGVYMFGTARARQYSTGDHIPVEDFPMRFGSTLNGILGWVTKMIEPSDVHIAIERYIITPKTAKLSQQTEALEVTGMVKGFAALAGVTDVRQYAKANLKFANDDMLRSIGWSTPGMRHANDAARQAFALLKDVDYPRWSELVRDASMEPTTEG
jgi:hypothetical protein